MKKALSIALKVILTSIAVIVLFVIISLVRHKIFSSREKDLLTPLGELVEVNGHNMRARATKLLCLCQAAELALRYWILSRCIHC